MEELLEKIQNKLAEISISIISIQKDVFYHIKRTDLNEDQIKIVVNRLESIERETQDKINELRISVESQKKAFKLIMGAAVIINIGLSVLQLVKG